MGQNKPESILRLKLDSNEVQKTIEKLQLRIHDRFPDSGLEGVCRSFLNVSRQSGQTLAWISKPNYGIRIIIILLIILMIAAAIRAAVEVKVSTDGINLAEFIQMIEAAINSMIFIAAGIVFFVTFETRRKRKRVTQAVNQLRSIAHIIDAHQLTKDPDTVRQIHIHTPNSPQRQLSGYELGRYLDYCTEMLSLIGNLGFLYVQEFDDHIANSAVNDLENLTTGLSRKIWQKIMIIRSEEKH
jgi:hypothetical protein